MEHRGPPVAAGWTAANEIESFELVDVLGGGRRADAEELGDFPDLVRPVVTNELEKMELGEGERSGAYFAQELELEKLANNGGKDVAVA
jgi:hypothetical protein